MDCTNPHTSGIDRFLDAHPLAFMLIVLASIIGFSIACVAGYYAYQRATARRDGRKCVGGDVPCNCTCSYDCLLA